MQNRKQFSKTIREILWNKLKKCNCNDSDCGPKTHRLCPGCKRKILKCAYAGEQSNSKFKWNIDHKISIKNDGTNQIENLQILCVTCNEKKGSQ